MHIIPPDSYRDGGSISNTKIFQFGVDFELTIQSTPPFRLFIQDEYPARVPIAIGRDIDQPSI